VSSRLHRTPEQIALFLEEHRRKENRWHNTSRARRAGTEDAKRAIERRLNGRLVAALGKAGLSTITRATLLKPTLTYIDARGRVWQEDLRSAEQLIDEWKRQQKKGHRRCNAPKKGSHHPAKKTRK